MEKTKNVVLKLASLFYTDFHWKLLSVALAFVLWFVGTNVTNPVDIIPYNHIQPIILHRDHLAQNNIVLLNEQEVNNTRISASIQATRSDHALIQAARDENIRASIDLSTINFEHVLAANEPITVPLDVDLFIHQNFITRTMSPSTVNLLLDRHDVMTLPIAVDVIGSPREGFEAQQPMLSHRLVRLTGARSVLDDVADVRVRVYVNEAYEAVEDVEPLIVYNNRREIITDKVNLNIREVHIQVPVFPYASVPLRVTPVGTPMPGFMVTEIIFEPQQVSVMGIAEILEGANYLMLGEVDVHMTNATTSYTFDIRESLAGSGMSLRAGAPTEATVTVVVERVISRDFLMPLENITVYGYTRSFTFESEDAVVLTMRGRESVISALTLGQILASVDLTGLGAGTHTVQVDVTPPARATLANLATVAITIEPEPIIFEPDDPPDWTADLDDDEDEEEVLD